MYIHSTFTACTILRFYEHVYREIKKWLGSGFEPMTLCIPARCLDRYATSLNVQCWKVAVITAWDWFTWGWWRTASRAPGPTMPAPARASTLISLKPQSAAKQDLVQVSRTRMWRCTAAWLRNSLLLERWQVAVQLTQTKRAAPQWIGWPASGPAMDARLPQTIGSRCEQVQVRL